MEPGARRLGVVAPGVTRVPRAESREPRAESREPKAESREPRAEGLQGVHMKAIVAAAALVVATASAFAQGERRPASPPGSAAVEIGSRLEPEGAAEPQY